MNLKEQIFTIKRAPVDYDILGVLRMRWSPRTFSKQKLSDNNVNRIFEAARWSASRNNKQPWKFIYAHKGSDGYVDIKSLNKDANEEIPKDAQLLVLALYKEYDDSNKFSALYDLGLSIGNMTVQAQYLNIGVRHYQLIDEQKAKEIFKLAKYEHCAAILALGHYPKSFDDFSDNEKKELLKNRERKSIETFAENYSK